MLHRIVSSPGFDRAAGALICYAAAILLLVLGIQAVTRFAERPFEIVVGLLAVCAVAISMTSLGILSGNNRRRDEVE